MMVVEGVLVAFRVMCLAGVVEGCVQVVEGDVDGLRVMWLG